MDTLTEAVLAVADPLDRAKEATDVLDRLTTAIEELSAVRLDALQAALASPALTRTQVAQHLGITKGRLTQLLYPRTPRDVETTPTTPATPKKPSKPLARHLHRYAPVSWTRRGGQMEVTLACECGQTRVEPVVHLPKELEGTYPAA